MQERKVETMLLDMLMGLVSGFQSGDLEALMGAKVWTRPASSHPLH